MRWSACRADSRFSWMVACFVVLPIFSIFTTRPPVLNKYKVKNRHSPTPQQSIRLFLSMHSHLALHSAMAGLFLLDFVLFCFFILTQLFDSIVFYPSHRFTPLHSVLLNFICSVLDQVSYLSDQPLYSFKMFYIYGSWAISESGFHRRVFPRAKFLHKQFIIQIVGG